MQDLQVIYIILPLALAVVILSLVLILISQLRKEMRLSKLKMVADQYMVKVDSVTKLMENRIAQFNDQLELKVRAGNEILSKVETQIGELGGYSEDLSNLRAAMTTYHQALNELTELTAKSDDEIRGLEKRSEVITQVQSAITEFKRKFEEHRRTIKDNEAHLNEVQGEFERKTFERMGSFDTGMNDRISACESRIGGVIGGFEARVASDLKRFDAQMGTRIDECQRQIVSDVESHESRIRGIKESNLSEFETKVGTQLNDKVTRLNDAFAAVAATVKELSTELDERSSALRDLVGGLDSGVDEKIQELERRYAVLVGERQELEALHEAKGAALKELDGLRQEKLLLESLIEQRMAASEPEDPPVEFRPFGNPEVMEVPEPTEIPETSEATEVPEIQEASEIQEVSEIQDAADVPEVEAEEGEESVFDRENEKDGLPEQKFVPIGESEEIRFD